MLLMAFGTVWACLLSKDFCSYVLVMLHHSAEAADESAGQTHKTEAANVPNNFEPDEKLVRHEADVKR